VVGEEGKERAAQRKQKKLQKRGHMSEFNARDYLKMTEKSIPEGAKGGIRFTVGGTAKLFSVGCEKGTDLIICSFGDNLCGGDLGIACDRKGPQGRPKHLSIGTY